MENRKKFRIEYEIVNVEYGLEDEFDEGQEKVSPVIYLELSRLIVLGDKNSRIFNSKNFQPAFLELCFSVEVFNSFTGLEWDGSEEWVKKMEEILTGTVYELDLGMEKALKNKTLKNKVIEENKVVVKFPKKIKSYNAIDFLENYIGNKSILFDRVVYDKNHTITLLVPINHKDGIVEIINQEGVYLEIIAMTYKEYTKKNNK